ncbi:trigger factor [Piscirickettsia litoralis]|uniref:Trigger factor n=1 Tax=Piscirickettsia litoralis TaxID=1891921 RepID=A0ABX3A0K2_9GAMM|nr:trigger factor [Piscirickettsia litoralis]ODN42391.1 trigger factor [Piscirickettsia litoralis]
MRVAVEAGEGLERRLDIAVPAARIDGEVDKRLKKLGRTAKMDGFRPGKVPFGVVKSRYGASVYQEVASEVMQSSFYEAVQQEELHPAGYPRFELAKEAEKEEFSFQAIFEIMPKVELVDLTDTDVEKEVGTIEDKDVDNMLETLRKQHCNWVKVERESKDGDRLAIDFEGRKDGETFAGGSSENFSLVLGSGMMIPGFEDGIVGAKPGDERVINVTFPENYQVSELAGQPAEFTVKVHSIEEPELPEINDDFAKRLEVKGETVDALRDELRTTMQRELDLSVQNKNKTAILDLLVEKNTVDLPKTLIDAEIGRLQQQMQQQYGQMQGAKAPEFPASMFEEQATRRVLLGLLVAEVIEKKELKPDADRVKEMIEKLAAAYEQPQSVIDYYYNSKEKLAEVEAIVMEDQVVDALLADAKVTEKKVSFDEVMNAQKAA